MNYQVLLKNSSDGSCIEERKNIDMPGHSNNTCDDFPSADIEFANMNGSYSAMLKDECSNLNHSGSQLYLVESLINSNGFSVVEEINLDDPKEAKALTSSMNFIIGVVVLLIAIIPTSLVGPLVINLPSQSALISAIWRTQG